VAQLVEADHHDAAQQGGPDGDEHHGDHAAGGEHREDEERSREREQVDRERSEAESHGDGTAEAESGCRRRREPGGEPPES
jgi:hypothetical protein